MKYRKFTDEDIAILDRFDWMPYHQEHAQPGNYSRVQDIAINNGLTRDKNKFPLAHKAMRDYYANR